VTWPLGSTHSDAFDSVVRSSGVDLDDVLTIAVNGFKARLETIVLIGKRLPDHLPVTMSRIGAKDDP
jgi:hypothetical protein